MNGPDTLTPRAPKTYEIGEAERAGVAHALTSRISRDIEDVLDGGVDLNGAGLDGDAAAGPSLALEARQLDQLGSLFKLLSDRTRLCILQILCDGEMNVTALCRRLNLPQPTVSHHLGLLRMNRLISNRRSGKQVYYRLHDRIQGAAGTPEEQPSGLHIVDEGYSMQILTQRQADIYPRLEAPVLQASR